MKTTDELPNESQLNVCKLIDVLEKKYDVLEKKYIKIARLKDFIEVNEFHSNNRLKSLIELQKEHKNSCKKNITVMWVILLIIFIQDLVRIL